MAVRDNTGQLFGLTLLLGGPCLLFNIFEFKASHFRHLAKTLEALCVKDSVWCDLRRSAGGH